MRAPEQDDGNRLFSGCLLGFWGVSCELSNMAMLCQRLGKLATHLAPTEAWWNSCGGVFEGFARGRRNKCPLKEAWGPLWTEQHFMQVERVITIIPALNRNILAQDSYHFHSSHGIRNCDLVDDLDWPKQWLSAFRSLLLFRCVLFFAFGSWKQILGTQTFLHQGSFKISCWAFLNFVLFQQ